MAAKISARQIVTQKPVRPSPPKNQKPAKKQEQKSQPEPWGRDVFERSGPAGRAAKNSRVVLLDREGFPIKGRSSQNAPQKPAVEKPKRKYEPGHSLAKVEAGKVLQSGHKGQSVREIQRLLNQTGADPALNENGYFGSGTKRAVMVHQMMHGLKMDGLVGPDTLKSLRTHNHDSIQKDPKFQSLPKNTQQAIVASFASPAAMFSVKARQNLTDLVLDQGFSKLDPKHQKEMIEIQSKSPDNDDLMSDLRFLGRKNSFKALSKETKSIALKEIGRHHGNDNAAFIARNELSTLINSGAYARLNGYEQARVVRYLGGTNIRSTMERKALIPFLNTHRGAPDLMGVLRRQRFLPDTVSAPRGTFDSRRAPYSISGPQRIKKHTFETGSRSADKYQVRIKGKTIDVYFPTQSRISAVKTAARNKSKSMEFLPKEQIAKALSALPKPLLDRMDRIVVEDRIQIRKTSSRREVLMKADLDRGVGVVHVYPTSRRKAQESTDGTMIHEAAHIRELKEFKPSDWAKWKRAMKSDIVSASNYPQEQPNQRLKLAEDFGETVQLYQQVLGTKEEDEWRGIMPERFKFLDAWFK